MKSTRDMVVDKLGSAPPRQVIHSVLKDRGGIMKVKSSCEYPRDRMQIYNVNRQRKVAAGKSVITSDPLLDILAKAKEEQQGRQEDMLIREIPMFPEPIVFLSTQQQLADIERFCTNPEQFCVLGVDATFQIASYYYTFTTYRNLMLRTDKGNNPVFIGPGILHKQKLHNSYKTLPLLMTKYNQKTSGVLVFGTDGEENLVNSFSEVFENAQHLRCDIHMKDNVKRKLSDEGISGVIASEIVFDIFGKSVGHTLEGGLVNCLSSEEFDVALGNVTEKWKGMHQNGRNFVEYFLKHSAHVLRETARSDIRSMCGLGFPPKTYTQNANECMNRLIKAEQDSKFSKKEIALTSYVERIRAEIQRQQDEQFLAVLGKGQYKLSEEFSYLGVKDTDFYRMTDAQKKALKKKFFSMSMSEAHKERLGQEEIISSGNLSITPENAQIIKVPFPILKGMFNKASKLLGNDELRIWRVPQSANNVNDIFMVQSNSTPNPHRVEAFSKTGKVQCDKSCVSFSTYSLCSHSLAVSEKLGKLKEFLTWFRSKARGPNLTAVVNVGMPSNSGRKVGTRKRKGSSNQPASEGKEVSYSRVVPTPTHQQAQGMFEGVNGMVPNSFQQGGGIIPPTSVTLPSRPESVCIDPHANLMCPSTSSWGNVSPTAPVRPKPSVGVFTFARMQFLDNRVSKCYGCGGDLKPGGQIPSPPGDLIATTRLHRQFYKNGQHQTSPIVSSVYFHLNLYCLQRGYGSFHSGLCQMPNDLIPFLLPEHKEFINRALGITFSW